MRCCAEATAACALRLAPGLAVALDRRVWCRVDALADGLEVEWKDTRQAARAASVEDLVLADGLVWIVPLLRAARVGPGVRMTIHARVPEETGLGVRAAVAVALAAALSEPGAASAAADIAALVSASLRDLPEAEVWAAALGGCVRLPAPGAAAVRVRADPGRLEERVLLLDVGLPATSPARVPRAAADEALVAALSRGAMDEAAGLLDAPLSDGLPAESAARRVAAQVQAIGGRAWLCASGSAGLMAVWIDADGRRRLLGWLKSSGLAVRAVACRLDLIGLERETA